MAEKVIQFWFEELTIDDWSLGPGDMVLSKVGLDHIGHSSIWIVYLFILFIIYCNIWHALFCDQKDTVQSREYLLEQTAWEQGNPQLTLGTPKFLTLNPVTRTSQQKQQ